jgi:curved DNA-binding protein CbpA
MMENSSFVDYYEILELSPKADARTVERVFRHIASRYHPDNKDTGNRALFDLVVDAHTVLRDPEKRAAYDVQYKTHSHLRWKVAEEASSGNGVDRDVDIQNRMLAILYAKRRRNIREPGVGPVEFERLLDCPVEHLEFHFWYLKEKGWIAITENGTIAITVDGVDRVQAEHHPGATKKQLTNQRERARG